MRAFCCSRALALSAALRRDASIGVCPACARSRTKGEANCAAFIPLRRLISKTRRNESRRVPTNLLSPPAVRHLIVLFFLTISLDGSEKRVLASSATMALLPRFTTRRKLVAFKLRLLVSDRALSNRVVQCPESDAVVPDDSPSWVEVVVSTRS